ncbi:MAG: DNA replication/repair protein RecF [Gammaproteobacteria bacterium]|nr:DNA replication/repair protein RecF [Gammaproteobacteria bacterium]MDH4254677.1 DNA replication/repair protein RecF [Gammaproteobacteria bacterium]MDH5310025.1 DNA replication/repair protein RecF [Gammaproteobacteria bacterium]
MALEYFKATDFRCLAAVELDIDPSYNLVYGQNASGKTSLLEALSYMGRGKSFRGASVQNLVRHGAREFVLFGRTVNAGVSRHIGVRNGPAGLETSVDGVHDGGAAALAEALPLQVIDPDIHDLVAGGPEQRRRFLDWATFHVEHGYLDAWRRFRRALKQRNAALRQGAGAAELGGWDREFVATALVVDAARRRAFDLLLPCLAEAAADLLGAEVAFDYRQGWASEEDLATALVGAQGRDRQQGSSQVGPQRADIRLVFDERQARKMVSRGQQKLLACAMVLGATELVQGELERKLLLLLDDPAAELDDRSLARLMARVARLESQVIATALQPQANLFPAPPRMFHVEQGIVSPAT